MFNAPINKKDIWNPYFYKSFAGFQSIFPVWQLFSPIENWPGVDDYNLIAEKIAKRLPPACRVRFIEQQAQMIYVQQIARHLVPTRSELWHDFFNNMTWLAWPRLKWAIYQKILQEKMKTKQRSPLQNLLTHFDESGMVICSDQPALFELIKNFKWQAFFFESKDLLAHCKPILIGHGMMERVLNPFLGLTAKAVFLQVPPKFFSLTLAQQFGYADEEVAGYILSEAFPKEPKALQPFPFLGWPGWYPNNQQISFFANRDYFRAGRSAALQSFELAWHEGRNL